MVAKAAVHDEMLRMDDCEDTLVDDDRFLLV